MAKASDFIKKLSAMAGIEGCLLSHPNGQIRSHNLPSDPDAYRAWPQQIIKRCELLSNCFNHETFRGISLQQDGGYMHIFPIRQYQLVVIQPGDTINYDLFHQIEMLIQNTVERG
jgi:hypothetical protein